LAEIFILLHISYSQKMMELHIISDTYTVSMKKIRIIINFFHKNMLAHA
jgi:hypothetical protein